jgi:glutathione S-transferase
MLIIWGRHTSSNVQKLLWSCTEMGVAYDRRDMAGKFGFTDEYLAMNPNRVVPTIDDEGFVVWESNACLRYLAARHGAGTLWPEDLQTRANADRWMDWQQTTLWSVLRIAFHQLIRTPDDRRDLAAVDKAVKGGGDALKILDAWLAGKQFVCGDQFTMGDIPVGIIAYRWFAMDIERIGLPNVEAWYERLCARPGYRKHIMIPLE